jgi:hypothetical protein
VGVEDCVEYSDKEGYRLLGKMLQGSLWNTIWVWSPANIETLDNLMKFARVG